MKFVVRNSGKRKAKIHVSHYVDLGMIEQAALTLVLDVDDPEEGVALLNRSRIENRIRHILCENGAIGLLRAHENYLTLSVSEAENVGYKKRVADLFPDAL